MSQLRMFMILAHCCNFFHPLRLKIICLSEILLSFFSPTKLLKCWNIRNFDKNIVFWIILITFWEENWTMIWGTGRKKLGKLWKEKPFLVKYKIFYVWGVSMGKESMCIADTLNVFINTVGKECSLPFTKKYGNWWLNQILNKFWKIQFISFSNRQFSKYTKFSYAISN